MSAPFCLTLAPANVENSDIFARFREIDRCAIFLAFCGRRFGENIADDMPPPKLRLLSPHDEFLEELIDSANEAALSNSKAAPLISMFDDRLIHPLMISPPVPLTLLRYSAEIEYGILRRPKTRCPLPHAQPLTISCLRSPLFLRKTPPELQDFFKV